MRKQLILDIRILGAGRKAIAWRTAHVKRRQSSGLQLSRATLSLRPEFPLRWRHAPLPW